MALLSVILPVYNGEKFLDRSIGSVLSQSSQEFELIIVDDGSTDTSGVIADRYGTENDRVKVIHKINSGVTASRLEGIRAAEGDFIAFIDADDWWDKDYIDTYMGPMESNEFDMVAGGCLVEGDSGSVLKTNGIPDGVYEPDKDGGFFHSKMLHYGGFFNFGILPYLWNKVFRKELLIKAYEKIDELLTDGEDVALIQLYLATAERVMISSEAKCHYVLHPFQKTANKGDYFYENVSRLYLCLKKGMKRYSFFDLFLPQLDQYMRYMIWLKSPESFPSSAGFYQMPFQKIPAGCRIVLHGAGNVGRSYHRQIEDTGYCKVVCWADSDYAKKRSGFREEIVDPHSVSDLEYDYIFIAVADENIIKTIKAAYIDMGVKAEKIVY